MVGCVGISANSFDADVNSIELVDRFPRSSRLLVLLVVPFDDAEVPFAKRTSMANGSPSCRSSMAVVSLVELRT